MAYARLEPFGQDYVHLMIAQLMLATGRFKRGTKVADLMPGEDLPPDVPGHELAAMKAKSIFASMRAVGVARRGSRRAG